MHNIHEISPQLDTGSFFSVDGDLATSKIYFYSEILASVSVIICEDS